MHAPKKVGSIPDMLKQYKGREEEMLQSLHKKYGVPRYRYSDRARGQIFSNVEQSDELTELTEEYALFTHAPIRDEWRIDCSISFGIS